MPEPLLIPAAFAQAVYWPQGYTGQYRSSFANWFQYPGLQHRRDRVATWECIAGALHVAFPGAHDCLWVTDVIGAAINFEIIPDADAQQHVGYVAIAILSNDTADQVAAKILAALASDAPWLRTSIAANVSEMRNEPPYVTQGELVANVGFVQTVIDVGGCGEAFNPIGWGKSRGFAQFESRLS